MIPKRLIGCTLALVACVAQAAPVQAGSTTQLQLTVPGTASVDTATAVQFKLPSSVAAVDGRVFFDTNALELLGVAPVGAGTAFSPVEISGGAAFGAYGLKPSRGHTIVRLVVVPHVSGRIQLRVVIDAVANNKGVRLQPTQTVGSVALPSGNGSASIAAPGTSARMLPLRAPVATRTLVGTSVLGHRDLDTISAAWTDSRLNNATCGTSIDVATDANGDGCIDVVDVEAVTAGAGKSAAANPSVQMVVAPDGTAKATNEPIGSPTASRKAAALAYTNTFTVTYAGDTADATPGNGVCADSQGRCSLRAAITESNWSHGPDLIQFNLPGTAPVPITLASRLPLLNDSTGGVTIDAYTQPGSQVNTAQYGSNAVPGVAIQGTGSSPRTNIFFITSAGNTIRGFALYRAYRPIGINGTGAHDNYIVGNWFGVTGSGALYGYQADIDVYIDSGPTNNHIGTPDLADRNILANATKAIDHYGPGTNGNVIQNNDICMTPSGAAATCSTGIDHDFGPKNGQIGGFGPNDKNVIGPTLLNGIEISHGWDPDRTDTSTKWVNINNHVEGNWIGFRIDGSYSASYRSGQNNPGTHDNGNAVNVYDGCANNVVDGNWLGSAYDGVNTMASNCSGTVIRNNIIGESPLGQAAPMAWWGVHVRQGTFDHVVENNIIRNATLGGIGLTTGNERHVLISRNIVTDTNGPAIHLQPAGGSSAPGSNNLYARPVITSATTVVVAGTGIAGSTVEVYRASGNAGQSGLPVEFLGTGTVAQDGSWSVPVTVATNQRVTALQFAPNGNTSELGTNVTATFQAPPPAPVADFGWSQQAGNRTVDFSDTSANAPTSWSWDFGDGGTSTLRNPSHTYAAAGVYTVALSATNGGGSNSNTKTVTVIDPPPGEIYAADAFGRTASSGWGNADTGGAYTVLNTAGNYNVASGVGTMRVPSAGALRSALLNSVSAADIDIKFRVSVNMAPAGGAYWVYAVARRNGTNEYRPKIHILADGRVAVHASRVISNNETSIGPEVIVPGLTVSADGFIWVRAQVVGSGTTTIVVKAWADGQAEPAAWQFSATDTSSQLQTAGGLGLRAYLATNVSTAPVTFSFDDYSVVAPQ